MVVHYDGDDSEMAIITCTTFEEFSKGLNVLEVNYPLQSGSILFNYLNPKDYVKRKYFGEECAERAKLMIG